MVGPHASPHRTNSGASRADREPARLPIERVLIERVLIERVLIEHACAVRRCSDHVAPRDGVISRDSRLDRRCGRDRVPRL
ncbi:hypothetical protein [Sandaracinus amylolyticus]|uniref:hypothetical protein n=1 Tax=Sandaracinus amylolyticus TaxID=927083 RepID=UPI001F2B137B|nr:hypothetical protein [Sandaracinus amylolyticus]